MSKHLGVTKSGYYYWLKNKPKRDRDKRNFNELCELVRKTWLDSNKRHGFRRVYIDLTHRGFEVTMCSIKVAMKSINIQGLQPRKHKKAKTSNVIQRQDLINRNFNSLVPTTKLVGDITYLPLS
jgi:hypothetical protein